MKKDAKAKPKAASKPSERTMPFGLKETFMKAAGATNDPVGSQVYASRPYAFDSKTNWVDRS